MESILAHFQEHGYARLGKLADEPTLQALRERADDLMLGRVRYDGLFFQRDSETGNYDDLEYGLGYQGASLNYRKIEKLEFDPLFRSWINHAMFASLARTVIGGDIVIYRALLMNKSHLGGSYLPWHQDGGRFWGLDRDPVLQIWTALDDAPEQAGCVEVFPASHARGLATPLGGVVPKHLVREWEADAHAVALPAEAGEVLLLHNHVWHRSGINRTGKPRRAFTVCYMSAETRCLRKRRAPREFFPVFRGTS